MSYCPSMTALSILLSIQDCLIDTLLPPPPHPPTSWLSMVHSTTKSANALALMASRGLYLMSNSPS